ncbi:MAG: hypothetical protein VST71_06665 [Nitrospirota bacterium]|nr:hypothetical protein [Nitrospirota bacterium]
MSSVPFASHPTGANGMRILPELVPSATHTKRNTCEGGSWGSDW